MSTAGEAVHIENTVFQVPRIRNNVSSAFCRGHRHAMLFLYRVAFLILYSRMNMKMVDEETYANTRGNSVN